jgi:hypothetical protein
LEAEDLTQKEMTRWSRAACKKPASHSTAAGLACDASDSMGKGNNQHCFGSQRRYLRQSVRSPETENEPLLDYVSPAVRQIPVFAPGLGLLVLLPKNRPETRYGPISTGDKSQRIALRHGPSHTIAKPQLRRRRPRREHEREPRCRWRSTAASAPGSASSPPAPRRPSQASAPPLPRPRLWI